MRMKAFFFLLWYLLMLEVCIYVYIYISEYSVHDYLYGGG